MTMIEMVLFTTFAMVLGYILGIMAGFTIKSHKNDGRLIIDQTDPEEDFMHIELDVDSIGEMAKKDRIILKIINKN